MTTMLHDITRILASAKNPDKPWPPYAGFKNAGDLLRQLQPATLIRVPNLREDFASLRRLAPKYSEGFHGVFAPTPICFIEARRIGFLVWGDNNTFHRIAALQPAQGGVRTWTVSNIVIDEADGAASLEALAAPFRRIRPDEREGYKNPLHVLCSALKVINIPHSIKTTVVPTHRDAQRKLQAVTGNRKAEFFSQRTVQLDLRAFERGAPAEDGSGRRLPWHYVRTHDRFRYGRDERVHGYWKGDESVGIVHKDYVAGLSHSPESRA